MAQVEDDEDAFTVRPGDIEYRKTTVFTVIVSLIRAAD